MAQQRTVPRTRNATQLNHLTMDSQILLVEYQVTILNQNTFFLCFGRYFNGENRHLYKCMYDFLEVTTTYKPTTTYIPESTTAPQPGILIFHSTEKYTFINFGVSYKYFQKHFLICIIVACSDYIGGCSLLINSEPLGCDAVIRDRHGVKGKIKNFCDGSCNNCVDVTPPGTLYHNYSSLMVQYFSLDNFISNNFITELLQKYG